MNYHTKIPPIIDRFINAKIVCNQIPLLPCVYGDFEKMQMGYRWNPVQQCSLVTDKPGGWKESWYVIAQNVFGDPFFVDFNIENYPVYTATHGKGIWTEIKVTESIIQFIEILTTINEVDITFPCSLEFLSGMIDLDNEFWTEVSEACQEDE